MLRTAHDAPERPLAQRVSDLAAGIAGSFSSIGLILGTLFLAASLTPSLVPRPPVMQGALSGLCLGAGYGIGLGLRAVWVSLGLRAFTGRLRVAGHLAAVAVCVASVGLALWWAAGWQNRLRALMGLPLEDSAGPLTIAAVALAVFALLLLVGWLFRFIWHYVSRRLARRIPGPLATLLALIATAFLFWSLGNGVLVTGAMRMLDRLYSERDARFEEASQRPADPLKAGGPGSLLTWQGLGRAGREMVAAGPDRARIEAMTGAPAKEPLRVYVGLGSAQDPAARAKLALAELIRIGAFERSNLVIVTPTGTGWVDPESQTALEYVLHGDVATVAVQYSYLASWIALLAAPDYGLQTARAVFAAVYGHWHSLPHDRRPRLYLQGLSLGAFNSDLSHDLFQVIGDPYNGALWAGPPFNSHTWTDVTRSRNPGSPEWLPDFRDGSVIRFTSQTNHLAAAPAPWGPYRVIYLQYASDAVTFFDAHALWRRPAWLVPPLGPDVSPDFVWVPVVTFLQLGLDVMTAVMPPKGHGHVYAFPHYLDAWASLTDAPGWTAERLERLKQRIAAARD